MQNISTMPRISGSRDDLRAGAVGSMGGGGKSTDIGGSGGGGGNSAALAGGGGGIAIGDAGITGTPPDFAASLARRNASLIMLMPQTLLPIRARHGLRD